MIEDPDRYVDDFVSAGAAMLSVHVEAVRHLHRAIAQIRSRGVKAGVALNPATPASALEEIADRSRLRAGHVGESGIRRTAVHPAESLQAAARARGSRSRRLGRADRNRRWHRRNQRSPTSWRPERQFSSPATRFSAPATRNLRHARCEPPAVSADALSRMTHTIPGSAGAPGAGASEDPRPRQIRRHRPHGRGRTTPTISCGSRWDARNGSAKPAGAIARWNRTASRCRSSKRSASTGSRHATTTKSRLPTRATLLTPVRIRFDYEVTRPATSALSATGHTVHAAVDAPGKPCRLPARVREILE